jgi:hypothetical protein
MAKNRGAGNSQRQGPIPRSSPEPSPVDWSALYLGAFSSHTPPILFVPFEVHSYSNPFYVPPETGPEPRVIEVEAEVVAVNGQKTLPGPGE